MNGYAVLEVAASACVSACIGFYRAGGPSLSDSFAKRKTLLERAAHRTQECKLLTPACRNKCSHLSRF
ncbi:hypothetical protein ACX0FC_20730, partial [Enterococcus faecium]